MNMQVKIAEAKFRDPRDEVSRATAAKTIVPVIMSGGAGTRLWPASRESMPKQFIPLLGSLSSFQTTAQRVSGEHFGRLVVVATNDVRFIVAEQLEAIGVEADIVLEPQRRDSAAAVAVAACLAARKDPGALLLILAADHQVSDAAAFVAACVAAADSARAGYIMTLGIQPTSAATGYGYIRPGEALEHEGAQAVDAFVEKPDQATAEGYVEQGYLWNSGNFLFRADVMLGELRAHAPDVLAAAEGAVGKATIDLDFIRLDKDSFSASPKISIDFALMQQTRKAGVLPVNCGWSDVGTWDAIWSASPRDEAGNALRGDVEILDTRNCLVHSEDVLTTVLGVDDIVVVSTPDAVMVASRERSGAVKDLVAALQLKERPEAGAHLRIYRPWGWYQRIDLGSRFQVKRIVVKPGARLSLQKHHHRAEHWVVVRGTAEVTVDDEVFARHENEAAYLPIGCVHRLANPGKIPLELIEVQVGSYTGEDDIVRFEDVYGR